jgi:ABC-type branched-subunit amino acid transport system ATPase component/ABC-type branched-subunit amino acid transport system permease subunit
VRSTALVLAVALGVALGVPRLFPGAAPFGLLLQGAEFGAVNGLLALGLVLTYRATRVINFSYGAMGAVAGTAAVMLDLGQHWNWFLCLIVGTVLGGLLGAGVDVLVMRRFFNAPRLIVMVATIGLAQVLGGIQLLIPGWLGGPPLVGSVTTPLSSWHTLVHPVLFDGDDLVIALVVPLALAGLTWFLLRTDAGVAVRSVADNAERAMLLGIPVRRLTTLVWVIAGALAAVTVMVSAPSQGVTLSAAAGPTLLLPALAAAVIAGMESLPVAFLAAVGLGVVNAVVAFNVSQESVTDVVFLGVILLALLLRRRKAGRAEGAEETWSATAVLKPIPAALRRLPEVMAGRALMAALVLAVVVAAPLLSGPGTVFEFTVALLFGMVAVSLVVLSGWSGSVSLGQMAFAGVGGVVAGDLVEKANVDLFLALAAAGVAGALLAVAIGLPALRIKGMFLAVTTLALAVAVDSYFLNPTNFSSLIPQSFYRPVLWGRFDLAGGRAFYFLCLGMLAVTIVFVKGLRAARAGRVLLATRDNPRAAAAMAVPTVWTKVSGFVLAGVIAGVAGGLYAVGLRAVGQHTFAAQLSLMVFSMAVIGGLGSIFGALLGVAVIEVAIDALPQYQLLITGTGLLVVLLVFPGGLGAVVQHWRDRLLRLVAGRRGIAVPSLVADRRQEDEDHPPHEEDLLVGALAHEAPAPATNGHRPSTPPPPPVGFTAVEAPGRPGGVPPPPPGFTASAGAAGAGVPPPPPGFSTVPARPGGHQPDRSAPVAAGAAADTAVLPAPPPPEGFTAVPPGTPVLECRGVEISYGPVQVLFGVDLRVAQGEMVALLGTNGAGKSTLLKGVMGLAKVGRGSVALSGTQVTTAGTEALARQGVALMPGGRGVFPTLSVAENLRLGCWLLRRQPDEARAAREAALDLFPVLRRRSSQQAGNLSGGEQQMLSLAMALMGRPRLLLIDELSLGLAPMVVAELLDVVRARHAAGTTVVVVEQSVNVALELAQRAVFMEKGEVRFEGPTAELLARPDILRSVFIAADAEAGGPADLPAVPPGAAAPPEVLDILDTLGLVAPGPAPDPGAVRQALATPAPPGPDGGPDVDQALAVILECRGLTKTFGGISACDGVDLALHQGEILGLIGHNGAGKTTLMDLISGFLTPNRGRLLLGGTDIGRWSAHHRAAAGLGRTFQEARLFPSLTVAETIAVAFERHLDSRDLVAAGLRLPASLDSEAKVADQVDDLVELMGLGAYAEKLVGELSTGTRRIVELACVLAQDPAVLLLDEPSGGVAQRETEAMGPLLLRVQRHSGCSILVIEHDMGLLRTICDRMTALELGQVIAEGTPADVLAHPRVIESYLGTDQATIDRSGVRAGV